MLEAAQLNREMHALLQARRDGQVWLGVNTGTLTAEMKDELGLDDDVRGIVISSVVEDSPAQSAGLQVNDVIVAAGEAEIGDVAQLVKVVRDSDGESIVLRLIRDGEARDIEVTPAPRPAAFQVQDIRGAVLPGIGQGFDIDLAIGAEDGGDVSVPQNFSISIKREGDGPADVTVVYKGETYEVTSETIDMLPEEVQAPVRRTLRGLQGNGNVQVQRGFDLQLPQGVFPPADIRGNLPRGLRLPRLPEGVELPQGVEIDGDEARRIFLEVVPALQAIEVGDAIELQLQARRAAEAEAAAEVLDDQEGGVRAELDELRGELSEIKQLLKKLLEERE
ncbi:MAG: PDZ domain-containing protein [Pirellulaceae bacterium]